MSVTHCAGSREDLKILIVIPTYNNGKTLRLIVEKALGVGPAVLVVNDGSTDHGPERLDGLKIVRIDLHKNMGKGAAILAAAEWAAARNYTHIITIDADGQHRPCESVRFIEKIRANPLSIIVGNRDLTNVNVPRLSRFGRRFSNFWLKCASGVSLPDSQCGFRAYPVSALRNIKCYGARYDFEVEILTRGVWAGLALDSVNVSARYSPETKKGSHFDPFWDNFRISRTYTRLVARNFVPLPHKILFGVKRDEQIRFFFLNPVRSLKMLIKERTSAKEISIACMLGIFLGTLPLIACHSVVIVFCATRLRLNRLVALNISHLCAPPLVPAIAVEAGYFARNGRFLVEFNMQTLGHEAPQRFVDYLFGSLIVGPVLAVLVGTIVFFAIAVYKKYVSEDAATQDAENVG